jgi:5-hydroxyisourate hydrolase-like protein (transthyretin family)
MRHSIQRGEVVEPVGSTASGSYREAGVLVRAAVVFILSGLAVSPAAGQLVRGVVLDAETGKPVARAVVNLIDADSAQVSGFVTGEDGRFRLTTPREGIHVLDVEHVAYGANRTASLEVSHGNVVNVEIRLAPVAIKLNPLTVV